MGRRGAGCGATRLDGAGRVERDSAPRLPRRALGRALPGLPPGRDRGICRASRAPLRGRRHLERAALFLTRLVPGPAPHGPAPCPRRDVAHGAAQLDRRARRHRRASLGPAGLLAQHDRDAAGIAPRYTPGGTRSADPLVVAVGRLVPVKRYEVLFGALAEARREIPTLRA